MTQTLSNNLKSSRKSDSVAKVRTELDYALSNIERLMRNAERIDDPSTLPGGIPLAQMHSCKNYLGYYQLEYYDKTGVIGKFICVPPVGNTPGYIASGSATMTYAQIRANPITSQDINILECNNSTFDCHFDNTYQSPSSVTFNFRARSTQDSSADATEVKASSTVLFRSY